MNHLNTFKEMPIRTFCVLTALYMQSVFGHAGELVYTPTNPSFGGNPNNASGLLAVASAQNDYKAPKTTVSELEKFTSAIQTAVLSRLRKDAIDTLLPAEGDLVFDKTVTYGDYEITLKKGTDGSVILVTADKVGGGQTEVTVGSSATSGQTTNTP